MAGLTLVLLRGQLVTPGPHEDTVLVEVDNTVDVVGPSKGTAKGAVPIWAAVTAAAKEATVAMEKSILNDLVGEVGEVWRLIEIN